MTSATSYPDPHHNTSSNTIFGFWIYLMTDCMMFAVVFAVYAVLHNSTFGGPGAKELFDVRFALYETFVLLTSSFTCSVAMLFAPKAKRGAMVFFFAITWILAAIFLAMQAVDFQALLAKSYTWQSNAFLSSYFTLVGLHGLHIIAGLLLMIVFVLQLLFYGATGMVLRRLTCLRIYWNFLYLIWIFTFAIVYLIGVK